MKEDVKVSRFKAPSGTLDRQYTRERKNYLDQ